MDVFVYPVPFQHLFWNSLQNTAHATIHGTLPTSHVHFQPLLPNQAANKQDQRTTEHTETPWFFGGWVFFLSADKFKTKTLFFT